MANLTKRDLVVAISNETGVIQSKVFEVIQKTLDHITDSLAKGDNVELRNFGVFEGLSMCRKTASSCRAR